MRSEPSSLPRIVYSIQEKWAFLSTNSSRGHLSENNASTRDFAHKKETKMPEGATVGAGTGGAIGGTIGLLAGIGALTIPGLGPFIAAGPIMAALRGGAVGLLNVSYFDYPCLVPWAVLVGSARRGDLLQPQMV
jgi:hypothetical protein